MSRIVQYFSDKLKTLKEYPVTLTKAVYDEDGNRLDNTLEGINGKTPNFINKDFNANTLGVLDAYVGNPTEFIKWLCINGYFGANVSYRGVLNVGSMASYTGMFTGANYASFIVWGYGQAPTSVTCNGGVWSVKQLGGLTSEVLWTNPDKSVAFAGQTVSIPNISNYSLIAIEYFRGTTTTIPYQRYIMRGGSSGSLHDIVEFASASVITKVGRYVYLVDGGISFGDAVLAQLNTQGGQVNNVYMIPNRIIGIK